MSHVRLGKPNFLKGLYKGSYSGASNGVLFRCITVPKITISGKIGQQGYLIDDIFLFKIVDQQQYMAHLT